MSGDEQRFKTLGLIRLSLVLGVVFFAGITFLLRRQGQLEDSVMPAENLQTLRYVLWGVSAFSIVWALYWKARTESAKSAEGVSQALIIGWAPGEAAALLGNVIFFSGGPVSALAFGCVSFAVVLGLLRIPARRG